MFYYDKKRKQKYKLPKGFKAQFDDSTESEKRRRNKSARKLARKNTRQVKRVAFTPVKIYKLSDKPLNYDEYLKGPYWRSLRKQILQERSRCEDCGTDRHLNLHHLYYYRHGKSVLYREREFTDVFEVLCYSCHMKVHNACSPAVLEAQPITKASTQGS